MDNSYKRSVLKFLKARNAKEGSFEETIKYANKLLEKLDYMQKANAHKTYQTFVSDQDSPGVADHFGDPAQRQNCENLQKSLAESHAKISKLAEQVINLKDTLDEKNLLESKQTAELGKLQVELRKNQELVKNLKLELTGLKKALESKSDDYTVLNISHSFVENKKNLLEVENTKLHSQLSRYNEEREVFLRAESQKNLLETENKSLREQIDQLQGLRQHCLSVESQLNDLEIENKKLKSHVTLLKESREEFLRSGSSESIGSADGGGRKPVKASKVERSLSLSHSPPTKAAHVLPKSPFPDRKKLSFVAHDSDVNAVMWYPNPSYLITAGSDRRLKLWEVGENDAKLMNSARDCNSSILSIDIDNKASTVLCASSDFSSRLWDVSGLKLGHTLTGHSGKVMSARFIKDGDSIVTGSLDKTLKLWGRNKTLCTHTFESSSPVHDVISKDSSTFISGHADSKIRFWDIRTAKTSINTIQTTGPVTSVDLSRHLLLTAEQGSRLKIFDLRNYKELTSMVAANFKIVCGWVRAKFSIDGKYCCCGSDNGSVFIWNCGTGALEREFKGHDSAVISCSWSLCGSYLATCGADRKCVIWSKLK